MSTAPVTPPLDLSSFGTQIRAVVLGASGGIGAAVVEALTAQENVDRIYGLSRNPVQTQSAKLSWMEADLEREDTLGLAAAAIAQDGGAVHLVFVATGILHQGENIAPEKSWRALSAPSMDTLFKINTIGHRWPQNIFCRYWIRTERRSLPPCRRGSAALKTIGSAAGTPTGRRKQR